VGGVSNWQGWLLAKVLLMIVIQSFPGANKLTIETRHTPGTVGCCGGVVLKRRDGISTRLFGIAITVELEFGYTPVNDVHTQMLVTK
jgi:hypothetical protein